MYFEFMLLQIFSSNTKAEKVVHLQLSYLVCGFISTRTQKVLLIDVDFQFQGHWRLRKGHFLANFGQIHNILARFSMYLRHVLDNVYSKYYFICILYESKNWTLNSSFKVTSECKTQLSFGMLKQLAGNH